MLFQPCRSCSALVTFEMSCPVFMNELNDDDDDDDDDLNPIPFIIICVLLW